MYISEMALLKARLEAEGRLSQSRILQELLREDDQSERKEKMREGERYYRGQHTLTFLTFYFCQACQNQFFSAYDSSCVLLCFHFFCKCVPSTTARTFSHPFWTGISTFLTKKHRLCFHLLTSVNVAFLPTIPSKKIGKTRIHMGFTDLSFP